MSWTKLSLGSLFLARKTVALLAVFIDLVRGEQCLSSSLVSPCLNASIIRHHETVKQFSETTPKYTRFITELF
jgi:hypothetical protein